MLQRSVFGLQDRVDLSASLSLDDAAWIEMIRRAAEGTVAGADGGRSCLAPRRQLYKCLAEFDVIDGSKLHAKLCRRPYWYLVAAAESLAQSLSDQTGLAIHPVDVLIDAPPVKLEVDINMDVISRDGQTVRTLGDVSPVASALAREQFDNHVKRVRLFIRADLRDEIRKSGNEIAWTDLVSDVTEKLDHNLV